ncbi:MAG: hypothetical protein AB2728_11030 [Candidatus Thiodiazotropha sp.]|nr:hypothetical protein [Candidatus Thiodiazotropha taylori]MBT3060961.1 hypothetical protein [Candidatus Thiodiazotropha sp. (ex Lucina pensylvanica)]MBV2094422.1 hypothetical protein [Candidatus Thiodiazotropha sp. (ex Codakia orbicularis)]PUB78257.1 MAG: hypothetical protein DBP03_01395 [gamma proteobacterium symbiont of Ctena orbiculata]MBT3062239.1 hypothetical protein [Candidatus Thiodiazotropha sp. (ex Lucina pensylvanica)]
MSDQLSTSVVTAAARNLIGPSLQFANYMSPPIPVVGENRLFFAFLVGRGEAVNPELGYQIWPPSLLALFDGGTGQFHELRAVSPAYFSLEQAPDQPMGKGLSPPEKDATDYLQNELHLFQCCDNVIAAIRTKQPYKDALKEYDDYFRILGDQALLPFYQKLCMAKVA